MTRKQILSSIAALVAVAVLAFARPARADLDVVATVPTLASIAKAVGGKRVSVSSLALPTQDPHFVDAKPSLALELNQADLLVTVGLDLEVGWLPTLLTGARNPEIQTGAKGHFIAAEHVKLLEIPKTVDRSQGDIHPGGNPHFFYDPRAAASIAKALTKRMAQLDPDNAADYQSNLRAFLIKLDEKRKGWEAKLSGYKGKPVIGYHKTWAYLADWLGFEQAAFLEPKPGIPPSPSHVATVLSVAKTRGVDVLLQETYYPEATAKLVAGKAGATLVVLPGGPDVAAGESYFAFMDQTVGLLAKGL